MEKIVYILAEWGYEYHHNRAIMLGPVDVDIEKLKKEFEELVGYIDEPAIIRTKAWRSYNREQAKEVMDQHRKSRVDCYHKMVELKLVDTATDEWEIKRYEQNGASPNTALEGFHTFLLQRGFEDVDAVETGYNTEY